MVIQSRYRLLGSAVRTAGSENLSIKARLKSIAKLINDSFAAESTALYILDEEGRYLSQKITHEGPEEILACSIPLHEGAAGACAAEKSFIQKGGKDLLHDELVKGTEREMLCIPVPPGKKIRGVISIGLLESLSLSGEETEVLRDISAVLGNLIHSEDITERSGKRVRNLVTLLELGKMINKPVPFKTLPSFILKTCHDLSNSCCTILRISGYGGLFPGLLKKCRRDLHSSLPSFLKLEEQYAAKVFTAGTPLLITDIVADGMLPPPSCVCVPLYYESRVTGVLTFFGKIAEDGRFLNFDEEDRELFEGMAAPVSVALEVAANNRQTELLASENARKFKELSLLYRISNAMHSTIKLNELISLALNVLVSGDAPIFERTMLFLVNERAGVIQGMMGVTNASSNNIIITGEGGGNPLTARWEFSGESLARQRDSEFSRMVKEARMPLDKSLNVSSRAILEKRLIHVSDAAREKRIDRDFVKKFGITEFVAMPLMAKDEVVGLVIVDNPLTGKNITRGDLRFLRLLLSQTGIAIENSMLYSRIEDAHRDFREVQQRLIQGEKLAAIGEMAASIAHELKGPLVSIGGLAKRMERKLPSDSSEWKYAETIAREAARLEKMLTDTLLFSKKAAICCVPCNINVIIEESLAMVARLLEEKNIKVRFRPHPDVGPFGGDFLQLKQVFINLFTNAAEAMKNGGALSISVSPARLDGADALYVKVLDTGGGIPLEILNNIFNPFFTTKEYGTGLGLPISHRIVANHGGKILVYNRIGIGVQFKVVLPVNPPKE
jgi:two-component system sensor histidine kinase HydH